MEKEEGQQACSLLNVAKADCAEEAEAADGSLENEEAETADGYKAASIWNINIPYRPEGNYEGVRFTRQGIRLYHDALEKRIDPRGAPIIGLAATPAAWWKKAQTTARSSKALFLLLRCTCP